MLTKFTFMKSDFLFWYSCILPEKIHKYIDEHMNCEDIAMQMVGVLLQCEMYFFELEQDDYWHDQDSTACCLR